MEDDNLKGKLDKIEELTETYREIQKSLSPEERKRREEEMLRKITYHSVGLADPDPPTYTLDKEGNLLEIKRR